jgi:hypothetical protein
MSRIIANLLLSVSVLLATSACSHAQVSGPQGHLIELSVVDRATGATLPTLHGAGDVWIEGRPGQRYAIRLTNRSGARVLAVLSVDGINAVTGQTASPEQGGYVLGPYESTEITGWRKSLSQVAAFEFAALGDSYAARTGRPDNVGVLGVAVFRERPIPPRKPYALEERTRDRYEQADAGIAPPSPAAAPRQSIGTAHGQREYSQVSTTQFERASQTPDEVLSVRYENRENLIALGVLPRAWPEPRRPAPFPMSFVPDP